MRPGRFVEILSSLHDMRTVIFKKTHIPPEFSGGFFMSRNLMQLGLGWKNEVAAIYKYVPEESISHSGQMQVVC